MAAHDLEVEDILSTEKPVLELPLAYSKGQNDKTGTPQYINRALRLQDPIVKPPLSNTKSVGAPDKEFTMVGRDDSDKKPDEISSDRTDDKFKSLPKQSTPSVVRSKEQKVQSTVQEKRQSYLGTEPSFFSAEKISFFNPPKTNDFEDWKTVIFTHLENVKGRYRVPDQWEAMDEKVISALSSEYGIYILEELGDRLMLENKLYEYNFRDLVEKIQNAKSPEELLKILEIEFQTAKKYSRWTNILSQGQAKATAIYGRYGAFVLGEMPRIYAQYRAYLDSLSVSNGVNARSSPK